MTKAVEAAAVPSSVARTALEALADATSALQARKQPASAWPSRGSLRCHVISRNELCNYPIWRRTFTALRKDHRYFEILEDTVNDRFDYRYFVITDASGEALAIRPFFLMDQDMLEGVAVLSPTLAHIRKVFPRFMMMRTLMVGCSAGEGHLPTSPHISAAEIVKLLGEKVTEHAKSVKAKMVVWKELPAHYRAACDTLVQNGFCRVPSMPMVSLEVAHKSFDEFMQKALRANAQRHLKKNLAATDKAKIEMQVTTDASAIADEVYRLYLQVFEKSEFRFEKLTVDFFRRLGGQMGDKVRFFT